MKSKYISNLYSFLRTKIIPSCPDELLFEEDSVDSISPFQEALVFLHQQPLILFDHEETILYEFKLLSEQIKKTCHQFDKSRKTVQFAETDHTIGQDLIYASQFIRHRYHQHPQLGDSWIAFMGLLMILTHVLKTENEVQHQLLHVTHIGREIILEMNHVLKTRKHMKHTHLSQETGRRFMSICLENETQWYIVLQEACSQLTYADPQWQYNNEYMNVVSMAKELFFAADHSHI